MFISEYLHFTPLEKIMLELVALVDISFLLGLFSAH